jgi:hypothetical protein
MPDDMTPKGESPEAFIDFDLGQKIEDYLEKVYAPKVPRPKPVEKSAMSFWALVGLKATFYSLAALGAAVFSSIRTGGYFYVVEYVMLGKYLGKDNPLVQVLAFAAFVAALLAFEGYAVADGFAEGEKNEDVTVSNTGRYVAIGVIIVVGTFSGLEMVKMDIVVSMWMNIIVAVLTSVGAGLISLFGGKNIGFAFADFAKKKKELIKEQDKAYREWRDGGIRSFNSIYGRYKKGSKNEQNLNESGASSQSGSQNEQDVQDGFNPQEKMKKLELVYNFVAAFVKKFNKMPTTDVIVEQTKCSRGYASKAANKFIVDHAEKLLNAGIINQRREEMAQASIQSDESAS